MRQPVLSVLIAASVVLGLHANCRGAERKPPVQAASVLRDAGDLITLTASLGGSFQATATEHFVILHEAGAGYISRVGKTLESSRRHFYDVFTRAGFDLSRSQDRLVWICFPQKSSFNQYAIQAEGTDLSWLDGYYSTLTNRVAIVQTDPWRPAPAEADPLLGTDVRITLAANNRQSESVLPMAAGPWLDVTRLTHELAHQLAFNSGVQKRGVMYPLWVSEGLATNFEFSWPASRGLEQCNTARCNCLLETYSAGELVPLREFVVQTKAPAEMEAGRRYYAQAWAFFHFVLTERPESLRTYLHRLAKHRPGRRDASSMLTEFTDAFGSPEALEESWNAFLMRQAQQALVRHTAVSAKPDAGVAEMP